MSFILTVEHVSAGGRATCCSTAWDEIAQTMDSINLKIERWPGGMENTVRYHLCDGCANRLLENLSRALRRPLQ